MRLTLPTLPFFAARHLRQYLALLLLVAICSNSYAAELSRVRPERVGMSSSRLERLDSVLAAYVEEDLVAGQVTVVLRKGRIVYSTANGMRNK